jgi:hypothetical protein
MIRRFPHGCPVLYPVKRRSSRASTLRTSCAGQ